MSRPSPHYFFIPLLALLATLPLLLYGCSCGHDLPFHVQSWLDAAQQFRHGAVYPRWAFSPAWQAGEPRFVFYPPLSWVLGALLTMLMPMNAVPIAFTWIVLTAAGFSMHALARHFASPSAAMACAGLYLANPYTLFNAFERGAYAELFASVWLPLIFLSVLQERPTVSGVAAPLALVWLTNAPAGVMASYTLVLLSLFRIGTALRKDRVAGLHGRKIIRLALLFAGGVVLGLALAAFYLLPAAYERRYVQVAMAIIPNLRYQDNFLFSKTAYVPHNEVTFRVSVLASSLLLSTFVVLLPQLLSRRKAPAANNTKHATSIMPIMLLLACVIGFLLTPLSSFVWAHLPELQYLQFPWRLMTVLSVVLALSLAPLLETIAQRRKLLWTSTAVVVLGLSGLCSHLYRQGCDTSDYPSFDKYAFDSGHGVLPTDEYTPLKADNDVQRTDEPGYWIAGDDPNAPGPGTVANPNETVENYDGPIPFADTAATRAPLHLAVTVETPRTLVLNLRDYPGWVVTRNGMTHPPHLERDDGLIAIALPSGTSIVDVSWRWMWDQKLGLGISLCALVLLVFTFRRSRKIVAA